jgi:hypothetical protein
MPAKGFLGWISVGTFALEEGVDCGDGCFDSASLSLWKTFSSKRPLSVEAIKGISRFDTIHRLGLWKVDAEGRISWEIQGKVNLYKFLTVDDGEDSGGGGWVENGVNRLVAAIKGFIVLLWGIKEAPRSWKELEFK